MSGKSLNNMTVTREIALMQHHQTAAHRALDLGARGVVAGNGRSDQLDVPSVFSSSPMLPAGKELLRREREAQKQRLELTSAQRSTGYMQRTGELLSATQPLDHTKHLTDTKVQDWDCYDGTRPTVHNNCMDYGTYVNVNTLRHQRKNGVSTHNANDGGRMYGINTMADNNYVEEKADKSAATGFHVKELGRGGRFMTEHVTAYKPPSPEYASRIRTLYSVAKFPTPDMTGQGRARAIKHGDPDTLQYGREGFGAAPRQDHTAVSKRGTHWLGIAPTQAESVMRTTTQGGRLEFQDRDPCSDPRAKFLSGRACTDGRLQAAYDRLEASQRHTAAWKSIYKSDISEARHIHTAPATL